MLWTDSINAHYTNQSTAVLCMHLLLQLEPTHTIRDLSSLTPGNLD